MLWAGWVHVEKLFKGKGPSVWNYWWKDTLGRMSQNDRGAELLVTPSQQLGRNALG